MRDVMMRNGMNKKGSAKNMRENNLAKMHFAQKKIFFSYDKKLPAVN